MTNNSLDVAKKICELGDWQVTNLRLQKILYLIHLVYVGRSGGKPFIDEFFEAWDYGPVVPNLYHKVKCFGSGYIENIFFGAKALEAQDEALVNQVYNSLKDKTPAQLVEITHRKKGAWHKTYRPDKKNLKIDTQDILQEYNDFAK